MELSVREKRRTERNLVIFSVVTLSCGFIGWGLDRLSPPPNPMQGLGALVWLAAPLTANLILRALGGDGWKDFGVRPNLRSAWKWYLAALAIAPLITLAVLALGAALGTVSLSGFARQGTEAYLSLVGATLAGVLVKNLFEEFAWRGYLTPRFEALGLHPLANALLSGLIWAGWHAPYYLYFLSRAELQAHTALSAPVLLLLAFLILPFHALAYGELRLLSKTVWTTWALHSIANALSLPLVAYGFVTLAGGGAGLLLSPGTEGILYSLLMGLVGYGLYRYRRNQGDQGPRGG